MNVFLVCLDCCQFIWNLFRTILPPTGPTKLFPGLPCSFRVRTLSAHNLCPTQGYPHSALALASGRIQHKDTFPAPLHPHLNIFPSFGEHKGARSVPLYPAQARLVKLPMLVT